MVTNTQEAPRLSNMSDSTIPSKPQPPQNADRIRALAWLLDNSITIPGTKYRIGLDPLIGLIPGIGDWIGAILSGYIVLEAAARGAPKSMLLKMAGNIGLEAVLGMLPFLGDLFDMAWKANHRNAQLLTAYEANPIKETRASKFWVAAVLLFVFSALLGAATISFILLSWIWQLLAA